MNLISTKARMMELSDSDTAWPQLDWFSHSTGVWQTDRQTCRRTDGRTT